MSNPGVIILLDIRTKNNGSFRVEDNVGEAIHIHYNDFRIDLSINSFNVFCDVIERGLKKLLNIDGFDIDQYDPIFLNEISHMLLDLVKVEQSSINLHDLIIAHHGFLKIPKWGSLYNSRVFKALKGDEKENMQYQQRNFFGVDNRERLQMVKGKVEEMGYPFNNEYIVLFNRQNIIRDGQHRAASLLFIEGNIEIPYKRFFFKGQKFNKPQRLWISSLYPHTKYFLIKHIKRVLIKLKLMRYIQSLKAFIR